MTQDYVTFTKIIRFSEEIIRNKKGFDFQCNFSYSFNKE